MYCSQCGVEAAGNFCSSCGAPLKTTAAAEALTTDWTETADYQALLRIPEIRATIERHAARSRKRLSGEEFLKYCDDAFAPLTGGVPMSTIAAIAQPLYAKMGVETGKTRSRNFDKRPGEILLALLCALARHGRQVRQVRQAEEGCVVEAVLPSDLWSFEGSLVVTIRREATGTFVEAGTVIQGQLFDWGKSSRCLDELLSDLNKTPTLH